MIRLLLLLVVWLMSAPARAEQGWELASFTGGLVLGDSSDAATVRHLAAHAEEAMPRLARELGVPEVTGVRVTVAPSEVQFRDMQPGKPPAWADGTAWPNDGLVFLKSPRLRYGTATPLTTVLDHELVHVLLGQAFGDRPVPSWLQEGTAKLLAREYTPQMTDALAGAVLGRSLLSLDELTRGFPSEPMRAQLAYAQSADLIAFMRERWGDESLRVLVRQMAAGRSVDQAVRDATGLSPVMLDAAWRARLLASPIWLRALVRPELWLAIGAVLFFFGGAARVRRNKERLRRWGEREALEDAVMQALAMRSAGAQTSLAPASGLVLRGASWYPPPKDEPVN